MRARYPAIVFVLLLVVGCTGRASDASAGSPTTVAVSASDTMEFVPGQFEFAAGETVRFVITNDGELPHEFFIGDAEAQQEHAAESAEMPGGMQHDEPTGVALDPGETATLEYTFAEAGQLFAACHVPGHYEAGMLAELNAG